MLLISWLLHGNYVNAKFAFSWTYISEKHQLCICADKHMKAPYSKFICCGFFDAENFVSMAYSMHKMHFPFLNEFLGIKSVTYTQVYMVQCPKKVKGQ